MSTGENRSRGLRKKYNIDKLVWFDQTHDVEAAIVYEKKIKGWRREKKLALIESQNPEWKDLAEAILKN